MDTCGRVVIRQSGIESWTVFSSLMLQSLNVKKKGERKVVTKEQLERERKILDKKGFVSSILCRDGNHVNVQY